MQRRFILVALGALTAALAGPAFQSFAADGGQAAWRPLFNGKDLAGWQNAAGQQPGAGWVVEDGAMVRSQRAGDVWTKERFGDFVLELEFKTEGNSGIFIRTDKPTDCVQTGIEIQVDRPAKQPGKHSVGAVYDALAPTKEVTKANQWNRAVITAADNRLTVEMNGEKILEMDLNKWDTPNRNPDGTKNKFNKALKEASVLVNLSKMKTHVQTGVSLAVKNHFAFLEPAESRYAKHLGMDPFQGNFTYQELILSSLNLQRSVSCVAAAFRTLRIPELCVVDGVISQEGNGPLEHGKPREEHVVAAAWNCPATIDAVLSTGFMGLRAKGGPYLPPHIQWASGLGLGTREMEEICLILAREDGIPASSINEVRNSPAESFALPATMKGGCAPKVYPRDTLLPVMTRALDELQSEGIDPNRALPIVRKKLVAPAGIISG